MIKKSCFGWVATGLLLCGPMTASAANLVFNGSFESGLSGWTIGGTWTDGYAPVAINYNSTTGYPTGAFNEPIPVNNAATGSPDAAGNQAAYFVSDFATNQSLSQTITVVTPGVYQIGFSAYAPANGFSNSVDALFTAVGASVTLASYLVSSGPPTLWQTFSGTTANLAAGTYQLQFVFNTNGKPAKDIVIDQVYMVAAPVPLPAAAWLLLSGLAGFAALGRRRAATGS